MANVFQAPPEHAPNRLLVSPRGFYLILLVLALVGAWVRFRELAWVPLWLDENGHWIEALGVRNGMLDGRLPLEATNLSIQGFHRLSNWIVRFPHALASSLSVVVFGLAGRRLGGPALGLVAAGGLAVTESLVFWGAMARPYGMWTLGLAGMFYGFFGLLDRGAARDWLIYFIAACWASHCHLFTAQLLGGLWVWFTVSRGRAGWRQSLCLALLSLTAFVPSYLWISTLYPAAGPAQLVTPSVPGDVVGILRTLNGFSPQPLRVEWFWWLPSVAFFGTLWALAARHENARLRSVSRWLLLGSGLCVLGTLFVLGGLIAWAWERYLLHVICAGLMVGAIGLIRLGSLHRVVALLLGGVFVASHLTMPKPRMANTLNWEIRSFFAEASRVDLGRGIIVHGGQRVVGSVGRRYKGPLPVLSVFRPQRDWRYRVQGSRWVSGRGGKHVLKTTGASPDFEPGRYLVLSSDLKLFCERLLGGHLGRLGQWKTVGHCMVDKDPERLAARIP